MGIVPWDSASDGELSEAGLRRKLELRGYRVTTYVYPPGTYFSEHTHAVDKIDAVLAGGFRITMNGSVYELGPGDMIAVPRGVPHSAEVIGAQSVTSLDAIRA